MKAPGTPASRRAIAPILLALVLIAFLVLLSRHLLRDPEVEPSIERVRRTVDRGDGPTLAPRAAGASLQSDAEAASGAAPVWRALPAGTKFQQRLGLGARLLGLRTRLTEGEVSTESVLALMGRRSLPGSLVLDAWERGLTDATQGGAGDEVAAALLRWMLDPRRDAEALTLHTSESENPNLRIWTVNETFPPGDLSAGEALLHRLEDIAGDNSPHGYDVVASSDMAQVLFPRSPLFYWGPPAAGVYATDDDLCLIRTIYGGGFQRVLLKHELVHAWAIRQRGIWASRFLEEGLAEYLSRLRPEDERLEVPPRRFANEFAALLTLARRQRAYGFGHGTLSFGRLMSLEAQEFYGLGQMGYLLAQAAVAYAGGEAVEASVREKTDLPLRSVIRALDWKQLVGFLEKHAVGGRARDAIVVEDLTPSGTARNESVARLNGRRRPRRALQAIRVEVPAGIGDMALGGFLELPVTVQAQDAGRIRRVLAGLRADPGGEVLVVSDATQAMLDPLAWSEETPEVLSDLIAEPEAIDSRADFVEHLARGLESARPGGTPRLLVWHSLIDAGTLPLPVMAGPLNTSDLLARLAPREGATTSLIVCLASRDGTRERMRGILAESRSIPVGQVPETQVTESLRNALSAYVRWMPRPPTRVLVIDLADGTGDAQLVADVFADALGKDAPVALWNPQRPVR